jgi:hypothetical protein
MELMLVVSSGMAGVLVAVVVPKDIPVVLIPRMISVVDGSGLSPLAYGPDLEVLGHIDHDVPVTKDIPGNLASFRGLLKRKGITYYEWIIVHHSRHDEEIVFQIVPTVLVGHSLVHATSRRRSSI